MEKTTRRQVMRALALGSAAWLAPSSRPAGAWSLAGEEMERFAWFDAARFGLFLHWGPYSVAGVEASWPIMMPGLARMVPQPAISEAEYVALPARFDPSEFDPAAWVRLARAAGMRYVVVTAKHHDGFCMFDAPDTDYKITRTPYGRDVCQQLARACADAAMPLGFYYSPPDMHHPGYRDTSRPATENWTGEPGRPEWPSYLDAMEAHLRKLLTDYGEVAVIWFDGLFDHDRYQPERFHRLIRELAPRTLVNDRLGPGDYLTPEQFFPGGIPVRSAAPPPAVTEEMMVRVLELLQSDQPREQLERLFATAQATRFPTKPYPSPDEFQRWETCMTMNRTWAYNPTDTEWKSSDQLIRTLVETASRGGNLLLNVGPTGKGTFPPQAVERLEAIAAFMRDHGAAIHGTTYGPVQGAEGLRSTERDDTVFLHLLEPRAEIELADYGRPVERVTRLGDGRSCSFSRAAGSLRIELPPPAADAPPVTTIALES